jgi:DNA polymerase IV (archaeal DinB-like DNA polymerase)
MEHQIIAHLDMDSFYASVEIRDDPSLAGKPVVVGSDPLEGKGRGVISTCSYEARHYGLHSGMPISQAWQLCPHAVYIRPSGKYSIVSARIMEILQDYTKHLEQVSIDEAYLDFSDCGSYEKAEERSFLIKKFLRECEGLSCSIGIAPARSYAKIASELQKPDGLTIIRPENLNDIISSLTVDKIPGIGKKSYALLQSRKLTTFKDLAVADIQLLQEIFGAWAVRVQNIASGLDISGLKDQGPRQSIGRETTFAEDTDNPDLISVTLDDLALSLHAELIRVHARTRTVGIRIRYTGFITYTRSVSLSHADDNLTSIVKAAHSLLEEFWEGKPVRLIGIRLSGLVYHDPKQCTLDQFFR